MVLYSWIVEFDKPGIVLPIMLQSCIVDTG